MTATLPVVELTFALRLIVPASALRVTRPEPFAETALFTVSEPASTSILMLPLPCWVWIPVPPIMRVLVSWMLMLPLVVFVAISVPIEVSMSALPPADPIPVAALRVATSPIRLGASPVRASVIAPLPELSASAVIKRSPIAPTTFALTTLSWMLSGADKVMSPLSD